MDTMYAPHAAAVSLVVGAALIVLGWWLVLDTRGLGRRFREFLDRTSDQYFRNPFIGVPATKAGVRGVGLVAVAVGVLLVIGGLQLASG